MLCCSQPGTDGYTSKKLNYTNMGKTILIGMNNKFSAKANKWLFLLTALIFFINGGFNIYSNNPEPFRLVLGILMLIGGCYYVFYGLFGFAENSRFASKGKVDDSTIELKNSFWKPSTKLKWAQLSSIEYKPYEIIFKSGKSSSSFSYNSNADVSLAIKQTIRDFAERKNIEVIGG
jgi:hypothetical protein